ncbi:MAG: hypothetical protein UY16_C0068G0001, partial [Candidatus Gottesmanbacteria bacterium GW2011_GWA2_47_9]
MKLLPDHIDHYIEALAKTGLSPATIERKTSSLRKFSQWAAEKGYLSPSNGAEVARPNSEVLRSVGSPLAPPAPSAKNLNLSDFPAPEMPSQSTDTVVVSASSNAPIAADYNPTIFPSKPTDDDKKKKKKRAAVFLAIGGATLILALLLLNRQAIVFRLVGIFAKPGPEQQQIILQPSPTPSKAIKTDQPGLPPEASAKAGPIVATSNEPWIVFFKGIVTGAAGQPATQNGSLQFSLYQEPTGGSALWTSKVWQLSPNEAGNFIARLGDTTQQDSPIPQDLFFQHEYLYLGIKYTDSRNLASDSGNQSVKLDQVP